jgi:uncharacterized protein
MGIFPDAKVLFSAAKPDGAVRLLINGLLKSGHSCQVDEYVVVEARRNLESKGPEALETFDELLSRMSVAPAQVPAGTVKQTDWLPDKDRPVLYAAMRLKCQALVTGDRTHFGPGYGKSFGGVTIHSPRSLAEALL